MLDGVRCIHNVLAASLIRVSGQIGWVDRRAAGAGFWHEHRKRVQKQDGEIYSHLMGGWKS